LTYEDRWLSDFQPAGQAKQDTRQISNTHRVSRFTSSVLPSILRSLRIHRPSEWLALIAFGIFCFVYPFAILLLSLDLMPFGMEWMSSLLLVALGVSAGAWLVSNFGWRGGILVLGIFALGLALEYVGVTTGLPFGSYRYTGVLTPELPGKVPAAI